MAKRTCKGLTKKGTPCESPPLKHGELCISHDKEAQGIVGFGGSQPGSGRPRLPKPTDIARQLLEDNVRIALQPHFRALGYEIEQDGDGLHLIAAPNGGAKLYGTEQRTGQVRVSQHDDLGAQIAAAEKLLDRVYGKPKQSTEITGAEGGPVAVASAFDLSKLTVAEKRDLLELIEKSTDGTSVG